MTTKSFFVSAASRVERHDAGSSFTLEPASFFNSRWSGSDEEGRALTVHEQEWVLARLLDCFLEVGDVLDGVMIHLLNDVSFAQSRKLLPGLEGSMLW